MESETNPNNNDDKFESFRKNVNIYDLKVNINNKRELNVNQLISLIPGNENLFKKKKKKRNQIQQNQSKENAQDKELLENAKQQLQKRKNLLFNSFTFKEKKTNTDTSKNNNITKSIKYNDLLTNNNTNNNSINNPISIINLDNNKFVPDYEPWDKNLLEIILGNDNSNDFVGEKYQNMDDEELSNIINSIFNTKNCKEYSKLMDLISYNQHPVPLSNETKDKENGTIIQFMLTKKEKRNLKKIYKDRKRKDIQEKIKLGLMKPKETKLTYNNMMQLFKNDTVTNPSQIYQTVKNSYIERENKMLETNAQNTLTKEQKKVKFLEKIEKDQKNGIYSYFFKINKKYNIINGNKFSNWLKIFTKKYKISGFYVNFYKKDENFLYAEGGKKALNKLQKRIGNKLKIEENNMKNDNNIKENNNMDIEGGNNLFKCDLVWKGLINKKKFKKLQIVVNQDKQELVQFLESKKLKQLINNL